MRRAHRPMLSRIMSLLAATGIAAGIFAGTAGASPPRTASDAAVHVTVRYRDGSGALISTWHGPRARADRLVASWRSAHAGTGTVTADIEQPPSCHLPTTYWVFRTDSAGGLVCYRYGGTADINIKSVYEVDSGNNAGYYVVGGTRYYVAKYVTDLWDPKVTVTQIHID